MEIEKQTILNLIREHGNYHDRHPSLSIGTQIR
jgi:hypothetical protein